MLVSSYHSQQLNWPRLGRSVLAQFDDYRIVVYQAFNHSIARFAVEHGYFGGDFSYTRMSWIKPGFLWMMYRCGWATKPNQERVLAITLQRTAFDIILSRAVPSSFIPGMYASQEAWRDALRSSDVLVQWDPDHDPSGAPLSRRAIQLGLRGDILRQYGTEWIIGIEDITEFIVEQAVNALSSDPWRLLIPIEEVYPLDRETAVGLGLDI